MVVGKKKLGGGCLWFGCMMCLLDVSWCILG